jgi:hypothetical protein
MYKIIGADQREYGPVTPDQMRLWIAEGRAGANTLVSSEGREWKPLSTYPEFAGDLARVTPPGFATPIPPPFPEVSSPASLEPAQHKLVVPAFVCSILGLFCCPPLFSTLALIFGAIAISQINQQPERFSGKSLAVASMILAVVGYLLMLVGVIFLPEDFLERLRR